ncbi:ssDNA-binding Zn-finger/Zn-ribbon topoisomerase 1 [Microvirga lupini]|uniref:SsDNA-binding Zn-finger/Zn-ribbon topoisomerase 1 n=1 Tax=Microvirga lupini TaxID=420324 RepID=A0A7W4YXA1_9HYPH|nr:hypothetical protein [Microvirga lupini]MBB3019806.1 ssDNA-binding Zn-finger/Zn-ribbon topoisomerase 1 [Microvirga lupini]
MFERIVQASEAYRQGADRMTGSLRMALKGCPECRTTQMIASPSLGICDDCGTNLVVVPNE